MFAPLIGLVLGIAAPSEPANTPNSVALDRIATWVRSTDRQRISVWTDHDESPYRRGDRARVYFQAQVDGYITVLRVDTDGRIRVLYPREPWEDNFARGGRTFEVLDRDDNAFSVDDYPGVGYVFAISSPDPFQFDDYVRGDHWDYRLIADGRVRGDPYVALTDFASRIAGPGEYDYDIIPYYVDEHYDYPRFVCYDCHSYVSYSYWNPYHYSCNRFRIVIYDDYYYYPYRYNRGRNVVIVRPYRPGPRYVFKDYDGRGNYVTRVRQRPSDEGRRVTERDRTSADVGGRGSIPAPVDPRRRVSSDPARPADQPDNNTANPRRRTGDSQSTNDRTGTPAQPEPRRRSDENSTTTRPNIQPRSQPETERSTDRRQEPERKNDLREVDTQRPPERRETNDRSTTDSRSSDGRSTPTRETPTQEPRRTEPRSEPRNEPSTDRRAEPRVQSPPRSEPRVQSPPPRSEPRVQSPPPRSEPRAESPPPSTRGQPTGEPSLRRRKPD